VVGRRWTAEEDAAVSGDWSRGDCVRVARRLERTPAAVQQRRQALGCVSYRHNDQPADLLAFVREHHAAGQLDIDIAADWNRQHPDRPKRREQVGYVRRRILKLPTNEAARRSRRQAGYRRQCEVLRVASIADLGRRWYRRAATRAGWPADIGPTQLKILAVMEDGVYRTREEIATAIGQKATNQRWWFKSRIGTQSSLANLVEAGLLQRSRGRTRRAKGKGKGYSQYEYWMPLEVLQARQRRNRQRMA
jgi:hypothetical protein